MIFKKTLEIYSVISLIVFYMSVLYYCGYGMINNDYIDERYHFRVSELVSAIMINSIFNALMWPVLPVILLVNPELVSL